MKTKEEILQACKVDGWVVKLPIVQLERPLYQEVAKSLELIGGKWKGGKTAGFVFGHDPTDLLAQIANGEKRNLKKEYQFFGTPASFADRLVELANIQNGESVLEPSAGQGAIIKAIHRLHPNIRVAYFETMPINRSFLEKIPNALSVGIDFLGEFQDEYDKIIANPPFSKNQDIDHIYQMWAHLANGGRLVSVAGKHWQISSNKTESKFREWLDSVGAEVIEVGAGEFKESGTMIATVIIVINK